MPIIFDVFVKVPAYGKLTAGIISIWY